MSETGKRIKERRKQLGISADKVAELSGVSRSTIFRYENGDIDKVPGEAIEPIAKALLTTPAYLMGWEKNLDTDTDFIAILMKDTAAIEHTKLLLKLDLSDKKTIYDMIEFMARKKGL